MLQSNKCSWPSLLYSQTRRIHDQARGITIRYQHGCQYSIRYSLNTWINILRSMRRIPYSCPILIESHSRSIGKCLSIFFTTYSTHNHNRVWNNISHNSISNDVVCSCRESYKRTTWEMGYMRIFVCVFKRERERER